MTWFDVAQELIADTRVRVIVAILTIAGLAMPVLRYFHDRRERKLRIREIDLKAAEVRALQRIARSLESIAAYLEGQRK